MTENTRGDYRPEWVPEGADDTFTTNVMGGVVGGHDGVPGEQGKRSLQPFVKPQKLEASDYIEGILAKDRVILSRAITLVESNSARHMDKAQEVVKGLLPYTGNSIRVGITGVPGAGKSTLIEAFGTMLSEKGLRVAVLAVDPSSSVTKGSILGDKTRMENLARHPLAFIRPSPSGGTLGGVARKSRESIILCEAAGYDVILVETVGVGQSEVTVRSLSDFFLLIALTGAGDELQGMKKGVMELADAIIVNKADGDNEQRAYATKVDYDRILPMLRPATKGWKTKADTCSALTGKGIENVWDIIKDFEETTKKSGVFHERRTKQTIDWMHNMVQEYLQTMFYNHPEVNRQRQGIESQVITGKISATMAAQELIKAFGQHLI